LYGAKVYENSKIQHVYTMIEASDRWVRYGFLGLLFAASVVVADNVAFSVVGSLVLYGLWLVVVRVFVSRSRFVGGMAMLLLSAVPLLVGIAVWWVGVVGLVVFFHGTVLALTGAARLDYD